MGNFIKGLDLCEAFFRKIVEPVISHNFSELKFTAGLLGYGSDVIGYDDIVSTDHMWGPRLYIFLQESDMHRKDELFECIAQNLPYTFMGFSVHFSPPDPNDGGIRHAEFIESGKVNPLIWIQTIDSFVEEYLGKLPESFSDWLALSEHRLLGFTAGKLFRDDLGLENIRKSLSFYPEDVKMYLIASQWGLIAEEQAFVKRCAVRDDEIGSRMVCARIAERLMRLCFLYKNNYAPYSKWFGTAFNNLDINCDIKKAILSALKADNIADRESLIVKAQSLVIETHNSFNITAPFSSEPQSYFGRDIQVLYVDRLAGLIRENIKDGKLKACPLFGTLSQIGNFVELSDNPAYADNISRLYLYSKQT